MLYIANIYLNLLKIGMVNLLRRSPMLFLSAYLAVFCERVRLKNIRFSKITLPSFKCGSIIYRHRFQEKDINNCV